MSRLLETWIGRGRSRVIALLSSQRAFGYQAGFVSTALRVFSGPTGVLALTAIAGISVRTISSIVLTRILTPSVFGLFGIIGSLFFTLAMITDLGFESFVVRHARGDQRHFLDVMWTIHTIRGIALAVAGCILAPAVAWVLQKPDLLLPIAFASLTFAINGFASFSLIVALRAGRSKKLSILELVVSIIQTGLCIGLAIYLRNIWAFIVAMIAQSLLRSILSYTAFAASSQRLANDGVIRREFFAFSRVVIPSSLLTLLISQSGPLFLAKVFTLEEFGLFTIAANLVGVPIGFIVSYVSRIVFPQYTKTWLVDQKAIGVTYYAALRRTAPLYALASGFLIGGAPLLISILYDKRYSDSALYLSLLAISAALRLPTFASAEMMTAIGHVKVTLYLNVIRVIWLLIAVPLGYWIHGAIGVVIVVGLLEVPALACSWFWLRKVGILNMRSEIFYVGIACLGAIAGMAASRVGLHLLGR